MYQFVSGVVAMGCWVVALFFLEFWRKSKDRLFALFAAAFLVLGVERLIPVATNYALEATEPSILVVRLAAFLLIILGIVDKNRRSRAEEG